jgi:hypothetical protein
LFTYVGLPLGTTRPSITDLMSLACILERRLASSSNFLSRGARLHLINSSLASLPLHFFMLTTIASGVYHAVGFDSSAIFMAR